MHFVETKSNTLFPTSHLFPSKHIDQAPPEPIAVEPVCNDHLYNELYYLWFIQ